jgi:hypothetical protein
MKKAALAFWLILAFSASLIVGANFVNVAEANPYSFFWRYVNPIPGRIPAKITIFSLKNNTTYSGGDLNLKIHVTRPKTPNSTLPGNMWVRYYLDGNRIEDDGYYGPLEADISTVLHDLPDGSHELMVEAECFVEHGNTTVFHITSSSTVFFAVVDVTAPVISSLSIENKIYSQNDLSLNCKVDESTSWKGYSLDGSANATFIAGSYFSNLSSGSHTLTVYANDTSGNMGASEKIYFTIAEPFPTTLVVTASGFSMIAIFGLGFLVYFKKRNRQAENDLVKKSIRIL